MSASRMRRSGLAAIVLAALALTGCGGNGSPSKPAHVAKSSTATSRPTTSPTPKSPFMSGLVVEHCYVDAGTGKLELSDFAQSGDKTAARTLTDLNNTASCDGAPARSAFTADFTRVYVARSQAADQTSVVGYVDVNSDVFTQLTKTGSDFAKVSETDPTFSQKDGRVYFYDVSGDNPVLKSMTLSGGDVRTESTLQQQFDQKITLNPSDTYPYVVPNANRLIIDNSNLNTSVYTADGSLHALLDSTTGELSVEKNGQATTYELKYTTKQPNTLNGKPSLGGFLDDHTLVFSDGIQIYRASLAGSTATLTPTLTNDTERVIDQVSLSADGTQVAFVYALRGGLGIMSQSTDLYTMPIAGGTPTKLHSYPAGELQGSVRILQFH